MAATTLYSTVLFEKQNTVCRIKHTYIYNTQCRIALGRDTRKLGHRLEASRVDTQGSVPAAHTGRVEGQIPDHLSMCGTQHLLPAELEWSSFCYILV